MHALKARGVESIIVLELSALRAAQAKAAGATRVVDPSKDDVPDTCRQLTDDLGVKVVFDCAGLQVSFDTSLASVRGKGTIVNVAVFPTTELVWKNPNALNRHQLTITGSNVYTRGEFQEVIDAIASGKIQNPEAMITKRVPLERAVEDGFHELLELSEKHVKILIHP